MLLKRPIVVGTLVGGPAFVAALYFFIKAIGLAWTGAGDNAFPFMLSAGLFVLYGSTVTVAVTGVQARGARLSEELDSTRKAFEDETLRRRTLAGEVELLSAMRDVSRIVNDEASLEDMLSAVARVLDELLHAEEIIIFNRPEQAGDSEPIAVLYKSADEIRFRGKVHANLDRLMASQCMVTRSLLRRSEGEALTSCAPLIADGEVIGALQMTTTIPGGREERTRAADKLEQALMDIGKHVALALKTISLARTATRDKLTGLTNRGGFQRDIEVFFSRCLQSRQKIALIMADIDHFKSVNDTHGHQAGDVVLTGVAAMVIKNMRKYDTAYRYGGEEIAIITSRSGIEGARVLAERLRRDVERASFTVAEKGKPLKATISLGVAEFRQGMETPQDLIAEADKALYAAKTAGRNRVQFAGDAPESS